MRANGGAAGGDGVTIEAVARQGGEPCLEAIRPDLRAGSYHPPPVRREYIPQPDGAQRPLGRPTVRDRVVQQACTRVMEPLFEANCQDTSDGFRPQRSAHQAVKAVQHALIRGWWVVEADIQRDVDTIDHVLRLSLVARRISDRRVLKRIRQGLNAGGGGAGPMATSRGGVAARWGHQPRVGDQLLARVGSVLGHARCRSGRTVPVGR